MLKKHESLVILENSSSEEEFDFKIHDGYFSSD